ncbi:MAG TPA: VCBS repeat-containing protein, partial [Methylomirabilota bacterium]|nr:VCBS repeat-containing protein [Methylomirabilota bacterium]
MPRPGRRLILLVLVAGVAAGVALLLKQRRAASAAAPTNPLVVLKAYETEQAQLHWAPELDAQKYGQFADRLWNQLNSSSNKLELLWKLKFDLHLPQAAPTKRTISHEISLSAASGGSWDAVVQQAQMEGWQLQECEIRHIQFSPTPAAKSAFYIAAHLLRSNPEERVLLEGEIKVVWSGTSESPQIASIDASEVQVRSRSGPLPFREILREEVKPAHGSYFIDPLIVWDLDQDGSSEIILATRNLVFARASDGQWAQRSLLSEAPPLLFTGMLGDFTQDGLTDFVGVTFDGFLLWPGTASGHFAAEARFAWAAEPRLRYAQTLTAGDIDADGDLDLFLGQYKVPFDNGQMPHPYFDAKDGHPSFLLLNDGQGNFTDVTSARGLGPKQRRRAYSSSFIDLDSDNDLDLIVVSDFYGIDAYANDGKGNFTDITALTFADPHALGMGHSFADFNADGLLDILMIGMNSPTADRL